MDDTENAMESENANLERMEKEKRETISFCDTLYRKDGNGHGCGWWECGNGWNVPLRKISYEIEYLNRTEGRRLGLRVSADQVKEKFGTLRFYYSIVRTYPWWTKILSFPFDLLGNLLERKVDYGYRYESWKKIPTRNLFLHSVKSALLFAGQTLDLSFLVEASRGKDFDFSYEHLENSVDRLVRDAERECFDLCEVCGQPIGVWKDDPRCETKGWIRYVCKRCAEKNGWKYEERKTWSD